MLLRGYRKEMFRPRCNPGFESLHCLAELDQDVAECLPYLNTVLGGFEYVLDPPAVTFKVQGKLITVHRDRIAINALRDEEEAERILQWLQREINDCWARRAEIEPCFQGLDRPKVFEILKLLPRTNCRLCGRPTCTVFAAQAAEGARGAADCPALSDGQRAGLAEYLGRFRFDD